MDACIFEGDGHGEGTRTIREAHLADVAGVEGEVRIIGVMAGAGAVIAIADVAQRSGIAAAEGQFRRHRPIAPGHVRIDVAVAVAVEVGAHTDVNADFTDSRVGRGLDADLATGLDVDVVVILTDREREVLGHFVAVFVFVGHAVNAFAIGIKQIYRVAGIRVLVDETRTGKARPGDRGAGGRVSRRQDADHGTLLTIGSAFLSGEAKARGCLEIALGDGDQLIAGGNRRGGFHGGDAGVECVDLGLEGFEIVGLGAGGSYGHRRTTQKRHLDHLHSVFSQVSWSLWSPPSPANGAGRQCTRSSSTSRLSLQMEERSTSKMCLLPDFGSAVTQRTQFLRAGISERISIYFRELRFSFLQTIAVFAHGKYPSSQNLWPCRIEGRRRLPNRRFCIGRRRGRSACST